MLKLFFSDAHMWMTLIFSQTKAEMKNCFMLFALNLSLFSTSPLFNDIQTAFCNATKTLMGAQGTQLYGYFRL